MRTIFIGCTICQEYYPAIRDVSLLGAATLHHLDRHPRRYLRRHPETSEMLRGWSLPWPRMEWTPEEEAEANK